MAVTTTGTLSPQPDSTHIVTMAKGPDRPRAPQPRDPANHSKKDPATPTRAKAARPDTPALEQSLADLLNPGIGQGRAGIGAQTGMQDKSRPRPTGERPMEERSGLQPPPDNSWDRRADFAQAHRARASVARGFNESPQQSYVGRAPVSPGELDPDLARALGIEEDESAAGSAAEREGQGGGVIKYGDETARSRSRVARPGALQGEQSAGGAFGSAASQQ